MPAPVPALDPALMQVGGDPRLVGEELLDTIRRTIAAHPRSAQKMIGPSEIGTPCDRKLALRLAGADRRERLAWRPTVGTAVHAWLAEAFTVANEQLDHVRYMVESVVEVGQIDGQPVLGSVDLYDRVTATVCDWKVVGPTTLRHAKVHGPSDIYRTQVMLYGKGFAARGAPVATVGIMYLPVSGDLRDSVWCPMVYEERLAEAALTRADGIAYALRLAGADRLLPNTRQADDHCTTCDFYVPGTTDIRRCPGTPQTTDDYTAMAAKQLEGLIA